MVNLHNLHKTTDELDYFYVSENPIGTIHTLMLILKLKRMRSVWDPLNVNIKLQHVFVFTSQW